MCLNNKKQNKQTNMNRKQQRKYNRIIIQSDSSDDSSESDDFELIEEQQQQHRSQSTSSKNDDSNSSIHLFNQAKKNINDDNDSIDELFSNLNLQETTNNNKLTNSVKSDGDFCVVDSPSGIHSPEIIYLSSDEEAPSHGTTFRTPSPSNSSGYSGQSSNLLSGSSNATDQSKYRNVEDSFETIESFESYQAPPKRVQPTTKSKAKLNLQQLVEEAEKKDAKKPKKILNWNQLEKDTRKAEKLEKDRRKRVEAKHELYKQLSEENDLEKRLILDFDLQTELPLVEVDPAFVEHLKPHQIEGIKFLYDNTIESVDRVNEKDREGSGCILAHSMGLGKTLQVVVFLHTILTNEYIQNVIQRVLIIVPLNVIENWANEFFKWFQQCNLDWPVKIFQIRDAKTSKQRMEMLRSWMNRGGILLITSNLFSSIVTTKQNDQRYSNMILKSFLKPGPDIVVIDEGHLLKNDQSRFNLAVSKIETRRRIILTGTPLQNNLMEYFVMVDFVKPQLLGTKSEFKNRFQNPVEKGQHNDSTSYEVQVMKKRIHVLYQMLKGCVNRCDYNVLVPYLMPKHEIVLSLVLTPTQIKLYEHYVASYADTSRNTKNFLRDKAMLSLIWNHPALLHDYYKESLQSSKVENFAVQIGDWYSSFVPVTDIYRPELSAKYTLLLAILEHCEAIGDKLVVFSQSLLTLNLIERFLRLKMRTFNRAHGNIELEYEKACELNNGVSNQWLPQIDYFRIDGSVDSIDRTNIIDQFNSKEDRRARLMLVSTKAGGVGTNLVGANRVIIFDASFNPSNDLQALFRVYRLGQQKPVYAYRFNAYGTMEDRIYKRQIVKQSLSSRVIDEQQVLRHYSHSEIMAVTKLDTDYDPDRVLPLCSHDELLQELIFKHKDLIISYHEHDSLLENRPEEELSEEERKAAWAEYERTRQPTTFYPLGPPKEDHFSKGYNKFKNPTKIELSPKDLNLDQLVINLD